MSLKMSAGAKLNQAARQGLPARIRFARTTIIFAAPGSKFCKSEAATLPQRKHIPLLAYG